MNRRTKVLSIFPLVVFTTSLVACSNETDSPAETSNPGPANVEVGRDLREAAPASAWESACREGREADDARSARAELRRTATDEAELRALLTGTWVHCTSSGGSPDGTGLAVVGSSWQSLYRSPSGELRPARETARFEITSPTAFSVWRDSGIVEARWAVFSVNGTYLMTGELSTGSVEHHYVLVR